MGSFATPAGINFNDLSIGGSETPGLFGGIGMGASAIPGLGSILGGLGGLFAGLGTSTTNTTGSSNSTQNQNGTSSGSTTPNLSTLQQMLSNLFGEGEINQYNTNTNLTPYTNQGLEQINQGANSANDNISNILAARGQTFSPTASVPLVQNQLNRENQQSSFLSQIPLLQKQLQQGNLQQLMSGFSALPTGVSTAGQTSQSGTSNTNSQQQVTKPGSILGGLAGLFGGGLAGL